MPAHRALPRPLQALADAAGAALRHARASTSSPPTPTPRPQLLLHLAAAGFVQLRRGRPGPLPPAGRRLRRRSCRPDERATAGRDALLLASSAPPTTVRRRPRSLHRPHRRRRADHHLPHPRPRRPPALIRARLPAAGTIGAVNRMPERNDKDELTEAAIAQATREYYDARPRVGDAWDEEPAGDFPDIAPEQRRLEGALRGVVQGRRVFEVACG